MHSSGSATPSSRQPWSSSSSPRAKPSGPTLADNCVEGCYPGCYRGERLPEPITESSGLLVADQQCPLCGGTGVIQDKASDANGISSEMVPFSLDAYNNPNRGGGRGRSGSRTTRPTASSAPTGLYLSLVAATSKPFSPSLCPGRCSPATFTNPAVRYPIRSS